MISGVQLLTPSFWTARTRPRFSKRRHVAALQSQPCLRGNWAGLFHLKMVNASCSR